MSPVPESLYGDEWSAADALDVAALKGPILIVGVSGFIGAKLFFSLAKRRSDVYGASRDPNTSWRLARLPSFIDAKQLVTLDLTSVDSVNDVLNRIKPRTVFNLSAYGAYERQQNARRIHDTNYMGTLNLVLGLREFGCDAFVQAGSSSEYGLNCTFPDEQSELVPNSDYAVSKAAASYLLKFYGKIHNFPATHLRLYSIFGPWEERDRLLPRVVQEGLAGRYPPLADPQTSRDFVYVDDATKAFVKAALTTCLSEPGLTFNIATGQRTTLEGVAQAAKTVFGIPNEPTFGSHRARKWDLSNWYGNPAQANAKLKWKAEHDFQTGLKLTGAWEKEAADLLKFSPKVAVEKVISHVIACYRDHQSIPVMYQRIVKTFEGLQKEGLSYEIVFVNDCSPTSDEDEIRKITAIDPRVIGVSHSRNFGSQSAFLSGLAVCTGDAAVLMDGDLQDPPEIVPELAKKWAEGFDVVYGKRVKREAPLHMQLLYKVFYRVFRAMSDVPIPVDAGDFSLMNRRAINHLLAFTERDVFLRGLRAWVGFKQTGVEYVRPERAFGTTTNSFLKNVWWAKKAIFSFSTKPLAYMQGLGLSMFALTIFAGLFYLLYYFFGPPTTAHGINTIIIISLALGGLQLFSLSILGDYLGKVLEEVKGRPRYIRRAIFRGPEVFQTETDIAAFVKKAGEHVNGKHR